MAKENLSKLVSELADSTAGMSDSQRQLLESVEHHVHNWDEAEPLDPSIKEMFEVLLVDIETQHPKAGAIAERCVEVLGSIGV